MRWLAAYLALLTAILVGESVAQDALGPIEQPVWETRPAMGALPSTTGPWRLHVDLRCRVAEAALSDCSAAEAIPQPYAEAAIRAASVARLAPEDAAGQPTEGREIAVRIGFPIPVAIDPPPAPPNLAILTGVNWAERPTGEDFARNYPPDALRNNIEGRVILDCIVAADGRLSCAVVSEDPPGRGFGDASLRIARKFRMAPQTSDGRPTEGGRARVPISWRIG